MRDYTFTDPNGTAPMSDEKRSSGVYISHGVGFILLLLAACLAVLVGLVVHLASPGQVVCTCETPTVATPPLGPDELRGRCVELVEGGDLEVCDACSKKTTVIVSTTATTPATTTATTTTPAPIINYRLPTAVKPYHYVLELQPEIYNTNSSLFTFNGTVSIVLNVTEVTSNVTLHKKDLTIDNDSLSIRPLDNLSDRGPTIVSTSYDEVREFYVLHLDHDLQPGRSYEVGMSFHAKMRTDGEGLYLSSYKTDSNETIYLATTQFEAPHARKAFPCFDEPALKATFDITLVRKTTTGRNYRTLTNTDAVSSETRGDYTADKFATTPVMPTYLLAFIVCDFDQWENTTSNITYRTLARPNAVQHAGRAQKYGVALFDWFETKFEPVYPITKLDNIAIPDFVSGAMENWGLITYRERILYEKGVSTASEDSWTVEVIAHEIAHQWFGNLVSPKWWWWLWLNESFASFWDFHAVEAIYPNRRSTEQFVVQSMHAAMVVDGVQTSHPMTNDVESNAEVEGSFDTITYSKGACVVRMMHFTMGEDLFIRGLNLYLKRHQYGVAEHKDLFNALTEQSAAEGTPINMTDIFEPWVTQMNYPLVTVRVTGPGAIHVRQERFLNNMSSNTTGDTAPYGYKWTIPITIASSTNTSNLNRKYSYNDIAWLAKTEAERTIMDPVVPDPSQNDSWVVVNGQQSGYYRVNYEERNWMALVKQLELDHTVFPPLTRAQFINDAWALQQTGLVKMGVALRTFNFLKNEVDYVPWRAFTRHDDYLTDVIEQSQFYGAFREFMRVSANKTYNHYRMNIQDDTLPIDIFQISRGSSFACKFGVQECVDDALRLYREWMMDTVNNKIDPNLIAVVTCNAVRYGGIAEWNFAFSQYQESGQTTNIGQQSFSALFCTTQPWLLQRMLHMALDNTTFRSSDAISVIYNVGQNPAAREITWNFIKSNFLTLHKLGKTSLSALIRNQASGYNMEYFVDELQSFANTTLGEEYQTSFHQAIMTTQAKLDWLAANGDIIKDWLIEQGFGDYLP